MKSWILVALIFCILPQNAYSTTQVRERIIFEGQEYPLNNYPMQRYFGLHKNLKPRVIVRNTALNRGYIGTYTFQGNMLFLKDIQAIRQTSHPFNMKSVLSEVVFNGQPLMLDWFNGILSIGVGKPNFPPRGFSVIYSHYILIAVKDGRFNGVRRYTSKERDEYYKRRFANYKKTAYYKKKHALLLAEGKTHKEIKNFFLVNILPRIGEFLDE